MHDPMQCLQNALAYFVMVVSYERKMFVKLSPGYQRQPRSFEEQLWPRIGCP
jgi:hypothetical protein